ncbi:MAG: sulfatase [Pricia sp.]
MKHHCYCPGFCRLLFVIFFAFSGTSCKLEQKESRPTTEADRPNILFIAVDDLRPELRCYGAEHIQSPHIDKLAAESTLFERAYCNIPVCGASRASILTGLRPTRQRFVDYSTWKSKEVPNVASLPMIFKNNDYETISNGKVYHHEEDDSLAWDEVWRPSGNIRDYITDKNIELNNRGEGLRGNSMERTAAHDTAYFDGKIASKGIRDLQKLKETGEPFFLALGFMKPHLPFNAPERYWSLYDSLDISMPANYAQPENLPNEAYHNFGELRTYNDIPKKGNLERSKELELLQGYYASVSYIDAQIGRVLQSLQDLELNDNTIVVLWGDHGYNLANHKMWCKHCTFETSMHVPLLIKVPNMKTVGTTESIAEFIDVYPTLCELTGIEPPSHLEGESLVPLLKGETRQKNYAVSKFKDAVALIDGNLFYTEWTDDKGGPYARMLFDHATDSLELNNLAEQEQYQDTVSKLAAELRRRWGDDFLKDSKAK